MDKPIEVIFLKLAEEFVDNMEYSARKKLFKAIRKTKERIIGPWFKKMAGSNGIYEFSIDNSGKFYRLFAFWDRESGTETLIIGTHGISKKTNKTPPAEIRKAVKIMNGYFDAKR